MENFHTEYVKDLEDAIIKQDKLHDIDIGDIGNISSKVAGEIRDQGAKAEYKEIFNYMVIKANKDAFMVLTKLTKCDDIDSNLKQILEKISNYFYLPDPNNG